MSTTSPNSRYAASARRAAELPGGRTVAVLERRVIPPAEAHGTLGWHTVRARERLDLVAAARIGDAELWWRLADANPTLDPADLTAREGRKLRLALPPGMPVLEPE